jgi:hypothetical protein
VVLFPLLVQNHGSLQPFNATATKVFMIHGTNEMERKYSGCSKKDKILPKKITVHVTKES